MQRRSQSEGPVKRNPLFQSEYRQYMLLKLIISKEFVAFPIKICNYFDRTLPFDPLDTSLGLGLLRSIKQRKLMKKDNQKLYIRVCTQSLKFSKHCLWIKMNIKVLTDVLLCRKYSKLFCQTLFINPNTHFQDFRKLNQMLYNFIFLIFRVQFASSRRGQDRAEDNEIRPQVY